LVVNFQVFLCSDSRFCGGTTLLGDSTTFGPVAVGETHTLSLAWDGGTVFTFGFDGNTVSFDTPVPFAGPPFGGGTPQFRSKGIGTRMGGVLPGEGASITATFDNVVVTP
jgi:hypothetical protein